MKINIIRSILVILLFGTFYLIFGFSSQNATESSGVSKQVSKTIVEITNKNISEEKKIKKVENIEPGIRKLAHFSIYTVVGFLLMSLAYTYKIDFKKKVVISVVVGFVYACSDEIHQTFVSRKKRRNT